MILSAEFPAERVDRFVTYVFADQLPLVEAQAVNDGAREGQRVQRAHQRSVFTVRRAGFVDQAVKIKPFATKEKAEAKVSVDPPGGQARASILTQHEADEVKTPFRGRTIAVPTRHVPRTGAGVIKKGWRPRELFEGRGIGSSDRALPGGGMLVRNQVIRGRRGTWLFRRSDGTGTVFMRIDADSAHEHRKAGADGVRRDLRDPTLVPLYQLVRQVDLDQRLKFVDTVSDAALKAIPDAFVKRFDKAIRTAR